MRHSEIYLGEIQQTIEARFNYTTSVKFKQRFKYAGSNPRAEDDTVAFISIHYNVSIKDPKKDTARRDKLNKEHQEKNEREENAIKTRRRNQEIASRREEEARLEEERLLQEKTDKAREFLNFLDTVESALERYEDDLAAGKKKFIWNVGRKKTNRKLSYII